MRDRWLASAVFVSLSLSGASALAQSRKPPSLPDTAGADTPPESEPGDTQSLQSQLDELRARLQRNEEEQQKASPLSINGYVDFGYFYPIGNSGVGIIQDRGNRYLPAYSNYTWTFLGDILGTPVNSRGEAADLGQFSDVNRFDSVHSLGASGFIVNEVNMRLGYQLAQRAILRTSVNFVPRSARQDFDLGDFMDVDLAELEYVLTEDGKTSIWAGKVLPVFGIEYKERKADQRFGVTPTLVHRYTSESQLGIKIRSKLLRDHLIVAASVTNNSSSTEQFHFHSEIDTNSGKMLNGRLALSLPIASDRLEIGASGEWGQQDWTNDAGGNLWFAGVDLQYLSTNFALKAQVMRGKAPGQLDVVPAVYKLTLHDSGYVELNWLFLPFLGVLARVELRNALVELGMVRAYVTKQYRLTGGLRVVFNEHVAAKLEYYTNREYGGIPQFKDDMFTSSLVLSY